MPTEADTCRKFVVPKLQAAGWDDDPHSIAEQHSITDGRIVPVGKGFIRKPPKRVDYLLRYTRDFTLAVVEAKVEYKAAADALQQAKNYAEMLGLKFAYATNGRDIIEFDFYTGLESERADYPSPDELWLRYRTGNGIESTAVAERLLTPFNHVVERASVTTSKSPSIVQSKTFCRASADCLSQWRLGQARRQSRSRSVGSCGTRVGIAPASTGGLEFYTWRIETSSSINRRTGSLQRSATRGARSNPARSYRAERCTSPSIKRSRRTSAVLVFSNRSAQTSLIWSSWMSVIAAARGKTARGASSSNTSSPQFSSEGVGQGVARQQLQPRPQEPTGKSRLRAPSAGTTRR